MINLGTYKSKIDESIKKFYQNNLKEIIEVSFLKNKDYDVICVPSHYYCNLGCKMCHLTCGIKKTMKKIMYEDLIIAIVDTLKESKKDRLLISFMGVGEPLLNFELIEKIYDNEKQIKRLGYKDIVYSISTMMPNDNIIKITDRVAEKNIPLKIHFSLHSTIDEKRRKLIPSSKLSIEQSLKYLKLYKDKIEMNNIIKNKYLKIHDSFNPVEIHYTLIDNVNDQENELYNLINIIKENDITVKFINFNEKEDLNRSNKEDDWVKTILNKLKFAKIKRYTPPGKDIGSSCGAFTKYLYIKDEKYKKEYELLEKEYHI